MTLDRLNYMIAEAISGGAEKHGVMTKTNILNAEYACAKVHTLLDIIEELYGVEAMVDTYDGIQSEMDALFKRVNVLYAM